MTLMRPVGCERGFCRMEISTSQSSAVRKIIRRSTGFELVAQQRGDLGLVDAENGSRRGLVQFALRENPIDCQPHFVCRSSASL
jgi:hypothetical protein